MPSKRVIKEASSVASFRARQNATTQPSPPTPPRPKLQRSELPQVWVCCKCTRVNGGARNEHSVCRSPGCNHVSWLRGPELDRECGYCADHVVIPQGSEGREERTPNRASQRGWAHNDNESMCFQYHYGRPEEKDCERCGIKKIEEGKWVLLRRIDRWGLEPPFVT
jgi:hypothetical protein